MNNDAIIMLCRLLVFSTAGRDGDNKAGLEQTEGGIWYAYIYRTGH